MLLQQPQEDWVSAFTKCGNEWQGSESHSFIHNSRKQFSKLGARHCRSSSSQTVLIRPTGHLRSICPGVPPLVAKAAQHNNMATLHKCEVEWPKAAAATFIDARPPHMKWVASKKIPFFTCAPASTTKALVVVEWYPSSWEGRKWKKKEKKRMEMGLDSKHIKWPPMFGFTFHLIGWSRRRKWNEKTQILLLIIQEGKFPPFHAVSTFNPQKFRSVESHLQLHRMHNRVSSYTRLLFFCSSTRALQAGWQALIYYKLVSKFSFFLFRQVKTDPFLRHWQGHVIVPSW